MANSELVGDPCPTCKRTWERTSDFERIEILESILVGPDGPDAPNSTEVYHVVVWRVLCGYCQSIVEVRYSGEAI